MGRTDLAVVLAHQTDTNKLPASRPKRIETDHWCRPFGSARWICPYILPYPKFRTIPTPSFFLVVKDCAAHPSSYAHLLPGWRKRTVHPASVSSPVPFHLHLTSQLQPPRPHQWVVGNLTQLPPHLLLAGGWASRGSSHVAAGSRHFPISSSLTSPWILAPPRLGLCPLTYLHHELLA
jgi:hypothetical protein